MTLSASDLGYLQSCAREAAHEAGQLIQRSRPRMVEAKRGGRSYASSIVTEVDLAAQDCILELLAPTIARYGLGVLAEEAEDDGSRLENEFFWSIDPLDGTLPFVEGIPGYAVSIALVSQTGHPMVGVVYDPVTSDVFCASLGLGISLNGSSWSSEKQTRSRALSVFADRSFVEHPKYPGIALALEEIARDMGLEGMQVQATAGAVMNACGILKTAPSCYFKFPKPEDGGGCLWDFAASTCLLTEAGAVATDIYGNRLDLNRRDSIFMNLKGALFASSRELATRVQALKHI